MRARGPLAGIVLLAACSGRQLSITVDAAPNTAGDRDGGAPPADATAVTEDTAVPLSDASEPTEPDAALAGAGGNDGAAGSAGAGGAGGTPPPPSDLILDQTMVDLGSVPAGETRSVRLRLTYTGASANVIGIPVTGSLGIQTSPGGEFRVDQHDCATPSGGGILANSPCSIWIAFRPLGLGIRQGTLTVQGSPGGFIAASLTGTGVPPGKLIVTPDRLAFPVTPVGRESPALTLTVLNLGPEVVTGIEETILSRPTFALAPDCPDSLAPGQSCTSRIVFRPTVAGPNLAYYVVKSATQQIHVDLTGTGN